VSAVFVIEWTFSPPDYFEQSIHINRDTYNMWIESGKVEARVKDENYDEEHHMRDQLHESLNDRFLGVQLFNHIPFDLSKPSIYKLHPDGRKDLFINVESMVMVMDVESVDLLVKDESGNVVGDTRRDRIEKKETLAELVEKYRRVDPIVDSLITSYHNAVIDPDNELVHLYEIRDALQDRFGGGQVARNELGLSRVDWSRLGYLANKAPVKQGRHRGQKVGALRDATNEELNEARNIAQKMIMAYMDFLENQP
jgi:hypothetical protein